MNKINLLTVLGFSTSILLAGCSTAKEQFDFSKKAPDEFAVVTRAPLEIPNTFDLPTPRPGVQRPQEISPELQAQEALFGTPVATTQEPKGKQNNRLSSGESALLQKAQADKIDDNIREVIDIETAEVAKENTSTFNKILGRAGKQIDAPTSVVDPVKEHERIIGNKAAGKAVTDGETPSIEQ